MRDHYPCRKYGLSSNIVALITSDRGSIDTLLGAVLNAVGKFNKQLDRRYYLGSVGQASLQRYWSLLHVLLRETLGCRMPVAGTALTASPSRAASWVDPLLPPMHIGLHHWLAAVDGIVANPAPLVRYFGWLGVAKTVAANRSATKYACTASTQLLLNPVGISNMDCPLT